MLLHVFQLITSCVHWLENNFFLFGCKCRSYILICFSANVSSQIGLNFLNQLCGYEESWQISGQSIFGHTEQVLGNCSDLFPCLNYCSWLWKLILPARVEGFSFPTLVALRMSATCTFFYFLWSEYFLNFVSNYLRQIIKIILSLY